MPFVLTRLWIVLSTPVAPDFPCHRTRVETRIRPTMEVFFFTVRQPCTRQQEFTKDRSTDAFVVVLSLSLSLSACLFVDQYEKLEFNGEFFAEDTYI